MRSRPPPPAACRCVRSIPAIRPWPRCHPTQTPFERLIADWRSLTYLLNNLSRGLGLPDSYPFVLSDQVIAKLRFVDGVIGAARQTPARQPAAVAQSAAPCPDPPQTPATSAVDQPA
ncbi:MAG: putative zinc-binding metallopeptidase [bacterium]